MGELRILLLSFHHRDELAAALDAAGWRVDSARRAKDLAGRAVRHGAELVVVDGRGANAEALAALEEVCGHDVPVVAIAERRNAAAVRAIVQSGATWILGAPFAQVELEAAIMLAAKSGGTPLAPAPAKPADALTGVATAAMARRWIGANLANQPVSILMIAPARFDMINSAFGGEAGDNVLRAVAQRIERLVAETQSGALLARMGGTSFAAILPGEISTARLQLLAQAITDRLDLPFSAQDQIIRLSCRIGIVQSTPKDRTPARLLRRAGDALAKASQADQPPVQFLSEVQSDMADFAASLHADLRAALMRDEIEILFQPQVAIGDGRITGVEALARWHHPQHGEIGAATLFAVGAQSDYLVELSRHIQRRAIDIASGWPAELGHLRLSINVTSSDIARAGFVRSLSDFLTKSGFPAGRLTLELTESGIMHDLRAASATFAKLRSLGCRVAIDDFGTGYSSLAWLKELPADYLKIDKGLADDIMQSARSQVVVTSVIELARSLGMVVIAEGVETAAQLEKLQAQGCGLYQGYLCSPAVDSVRLAQLVNVGLAPN